MLAFERIEPFGSLWEDTRMAVLVSTLANVHLRKGAKPVVPSDVFSTLRPPEVETAEIVLTDEERTRFLDAALFGIKD